MREVLGSQQTVVACAVHPHHHRFTFSRPHTLQSGNWLSKLLHCDKLSTGGCLAGRQREALELRNDTHLLGGTVCMIVVAVVAAAPNPWRVRPVLERPQQQQLTAAQAQMPAARSDSSRRRAAALDSTCTCYRSCPKYPARSSAGCYGARGRSKVELDRAEGDHVCWVSPHPQDC